MTDDLQKEYCELKKSDEYIKLHKYYSQETYWEITNTARQELPHSSFFRWLLDINGSHGLGDKPLRKFLEAVCFAKNEFISDREHFSNNKNVLSETEYLDLLEKGKYTIKSETVAKVEKPLQQLGRADVFLEYQIKFKGINKSVFDFVVFIENKVTSSESNEQTERYSAYLFDNYCNNKNNIIVLPIFLSPNSKKEPSSPEFLPISYQVLLDKMIEPLVDELPSNSDVRLKLQEYIRCLGPQSKAFLDPEGKELKKSLTMAVSKFERTSANTILNRYSLELLKSIFSLINIKNEDDKSFFINENETAFWTKLSKLFLDDKTINEEGFKELKKVLESVPDVVISDRVYTFENNHYKSHGFDNSSLLPLGYLGYEIIKSYISNHTGISAKELIEKTHMKYVVIKKSEYQGITKNDEDYAKKIYKLHDYYIKGISKEIEEAVNEDIKNRGRTYSAGNSKPPIIIDKEEYYVYRWWTNEQIEKLINYLDMSSVEF